MVQNVTFRGQNEDLKMETTTKTWQTKFSSWTWRTADPFDILNETAYNWNGSICCYFFFIGTLGNIVSFLYFKSKKKDISCVIYMLITANDLVISILVLPVGISFLSKGQPGIIFRNKYGCAVWRNLWSLAVFVSVFLVLCLCVTRTISLLRPFQKQKVRYLVFAVVTYLIINLALIAIMKSNESISVKFSPMYSHCGRFVDLNDPKGKAALYVISLNENIFCTAPAIVVAISCVISVVVLTRRNRNVQQRELQQSRNRATVTILLFALLYGVCNLPLIIHNVVMAIILVTNNRQIYDNFYQFDEQFYYRNTETTLLLAANSAANPILYFWRMPALREYIMSGIRRMLRLITEVRRPTGNNSQQAEVRRYNTVVEDVNVIQ